jgi:predicted secreted hydrolase
MAPTMPTFPRRSFLAAGLLGGCLPAAALPKKALQFPRDHGAHPGFRTEWWYITGHATDRADASLAFR